MKRAVEIVEVTEGVGLEGLLNKDVLLICSAYFYTGKLSGVNDTFVELENASIVYETGEWSSKGYKDAQRLPTKYWQVERHAIESYGLSK